MNFPELNASTLNVPTELFDWFNNTVMKQSYTPDIYVNKTAVAVSYKWINGIKTEIGRRTYTVPVLKTKAKLTTGDSLGLGLTKLDVLINIIGKQHLEVTKLNDTTYRIEIKAIDFVFRGVNYHIDANVKTVQKLENGSIKVTYGASYEIFEKVNPDLYLTSQFCFIGEENNVLHNLTLINGRPYDTVDITKLITPWQNKTYIFRWMMDGNNALMAPNFHHTAIVQFKPNEPNSKFLNLNPVDSEKGSYDAKTHTFNYPTLNTNADATVVHLMMEYWPHQYKQPSDMRYYLPSDFTETFPRGFSLIWPTKPVTPND